MLLKWFLLNISNILLEYFEALEYFLFSGNVALCRIQPYKISQVFEKLKDDRTMNLICKFAPQLMCFPYFQNSPKEFNISKGGILALFSIHNSLQQWRTSSFYCRLYQQQFYFWIRFIENIGHSSNGFQMTSCLTNRCWLFIDFYLQ